MSDVRLALRDLFRNPGFALTTIFTLALGIGATTAMFSVVRGVLLDPLPYPAADRLFRIFYSAPQFPRFPMNPTDFLDFRERNRVFESMAVFTQADLELSDRDRPERLTALRVSSDYFHVLGARLAMGRDFQRSDEIPANTQIVILSHAFWERRFASDRGIVGRAIRLNGQAFTVVGVLEEGFDHPGGDYRSPGYGATVDAWAPFGFNRGSRGSHFLNGVARLKPGVTATQASADINRIAADLDRQTPSGMGWRLFLVPLRQEIVGRSERMLVVLLGAVGFVLLIACVNVAGLLLVRAIARSRDMAVRAALGASRARLIRQSLCESAILATFAAVLGQLVAYAGVKLFLGTFGAAVPRAHMVRLDPALFGFTLALACATALLFGLAPAMAGTRGDLNEVLRESGRSSSGGTGHRRMRNALVIGEIALASTLLAGAGLFLRSFVNLLRVDAGFQQENVLTARVVLPQARYNTDEARGRLFHDLLERVAHLPGVHDAGASTDVPWTGYDENAAFVVEGRTFPRGEEPHARYHAATPDYFRAMGIPLLRGRFLSEADGLKQPYVIVINQSMAKRYWPDRDAVGGRISFDDHPKEKDWFTVVGVVGDVKDTPSSKAAEPAFWWSQDQQGFDDMLLAVRAAGDPSLLFNAVRRELAALDSELPLSDPRTMQQIAGASRTGPKLVLLLTGIFSVLALVLAAIGTYGVIAYSVAQRRHEFGIRIALGAGNWDVIRLVGGHGLRLALAGCAIGLAMALSLGRILQNLLYGVGAADIGTLALAFAVVMGVALLAAAVPARRASRVAPIDSLRSE